ncbi:S-adenosyl-L-methionine-dependent methyltransferase [Trichoderma gracile]
MSRQARSLEADPDPGQDDEADSALGEDAASSTASLTESILQYRTLHGRTYQSLDIFHNAVTILLGDKLFLAPICEWPNRALDVGTGTGIWAIDFADEFPETEVTAIDISPIQPSWVPPNLKFEVDDMNLTWLWPENHFDFIHFRVLYGCVPDWIELYSKAFRKLKPGGWMQDFEMDTRLDLFIEAGKKTGRSFDIARGDKMKESMEAAGFIDIEEKKIESLDGLAMYFATQVLGWKADEVTVLVAKLRNVVKRTANHSYINAKAIYGRKPL